MAKEQLGTGIAPAPYDDRRRDEDGLPEELSEGGRFFPTRRGNWLSIRSYCPF